MITTLEEFVREYTRIKELGWIRTHRSGPTGIGKTLEDLLGIVENNIDGPDFGDYELRQYNRLGIKLTSYWMFPEIFKAPSSVETVEEMIERSHSFLRELETKDYDNVLVVCHGGIIRPMCGYLMNKKRGFIWRPRPTNCEIRVFESIMGKHRFIESYRLEQ